jgi:hypothetical protein
MIYQKTKSWMLVLIVLILVVSCNNSTGPKSDVTNKENIDTAFLRWEEIAQQNEEFLDKNGWVEFETHANRGTDARQHYTKMHAWFFLEEGRVIKSLTSIADAETNEELQRFVINPEGNRAELIELRATGLNARDYARPYTVNWTVKDVSPTRQDLEIVTSLSPIIEDISIEEQKMDNGDTFVIFTVIYGKNQSDVKAGLYPENYGYIGKVEEYVYETETGNRQVKQESYIKEGGQQTDISTITLTVNQVENLPKETKEELDIAEEELNYYIELFSQD